MVTTHFGAVDVEECAIVQIIMDIEAVLVGWLFRQRKCLPEIVRGTFLVGVAAIVYGGVIVGGVGRGAHCAIPKGGLSAFPVAGRKSLCIPACAVQRTLVIILPCASERNQCVLLSRVGNEVPSFEHIAGRRLGGDISLSEDDAVKFPGWDFLTVQKQSCLWYVAFKSDFIFFFEVKECFQVVSACTPFSFVGNAVVEPGCRTAGVVSFQCQCLFGISAHFIDDFSASFGFHHTSVYNGKGVDELLFERLVFQHIEKDFRQIVLAAVVGETAIVVLQHIID